MKKKRFVVCDFGDGRWSVDDVSEKVTGVTVAQFWGYRARMFALAHAKFLNGEDGK